MPTYRRVPAHEIAIAAARVTWEPAALEGALSLLFGVDAPCMRALARRMARRFAEPPALAELEAFVLADRDARRARQLPLRRPPLELPPAAPSPFGAPTIPTVGELAELLEIPRSRLDWLADRRGTTPRAGSEPLRHYRARWVKKRSGGHRLIEAPKPRLREAQRRLLDRVLAHLPPHDAAHGFVPGRSVLDHARAHARQAIVVRLDLEGFFPSVSASRVRAIFDTAGYSREVAATLTALTTVRSRPAVVASPHVTSFRLRRHLAHRHLPQGAPTSPWLANLAAYRLDARLAAFAEAVGATYTRYADDLALSGDEAFARTVHRALPRLGAIALDEGFSLQHRKTRVARAGASQRLCGLVVNDGARVPRSERERLEAILFNCVRSGPESQNRSAHPRFREHLAGRIGWVEQAHPAHGERLRMLFDRIPWE